MKSRFNFLFLILIGLVLFTDCSKEPAQKTYTESEAIASNPNYQDAKKMGIKLFKVDISPLEQRSDPTCDAWKQANGYQSWEDCCDQLGTDIEGGVCKIDYSYYAKSCSDIPHKVWAAIYKKIGNSYTYYATYYSDYVQKCYSYNWYGAELTVTQGEYMIVTTVGWASGAWAPCASTTDYVTVTGTCNEA